MTKLAWAIFWSLSTFPGGFATAFEAKIDKAVRAVGLLKLSKATCTGTLLAPKVVLTAAHCLVGELPSEILFTLDPAPLENPNALWARVDKVRTHPEYRTDAHKQRQENDLALLLLSSTDYGPTPELFPALERDTLLPANAPAVAVGFGLDRKGRSGVRKQTTLSIRSKADWTTSFPEPRLLELLRGNSDELPCKGDSGGPILKFIAGRIVLLGVESFSPVLAQDFERSQRASPRAGGRFLCTVQPKTYATAVDPYVPWITEAWESLDPAKRDLSSCGSGSCPTLKGRRTCTAQGKVRTQYCCPPAGPRCQCSKTGKTPVACPESSCSSTSILYWQNQTCEEEHP